VAAPAGLGHGRISANRPYAPPQECSESAIVQESNVRRLVVVYTRPRASPDGQSRGILIKHISTGAPLRESSSTDSSSYETW
jgi:hypothetical protein